MMSILAAICLMFVIWQGVLIFVRSARGQAVTCLSLLWFSGSAAAFVWITWLRHAIQ